MRIILVVGPSGSGKDTLLRSARTYFADNGRLDFVRRYITRPPDRNEDNYYIDPNGFALLKRSRFFVSSWEAHANQYGIPRHALTEREGAGPRAVLCSISRSAIQDFEGHCYTAITTIQVTAGEDILRQRLIRRGREDHASIRKRLDRAMLPVQARDLVTFDNSHELNRSVAAFNELLDRLCSL